ncbi:MAG: YIP1 family protein, partial [Gammaproteobacteria bacterium]|nr:YIP1 family protein [Gammaproteobacteria bacterium]
MKDLIDIFLQPGPVLSRQYEKPNGWLPMLLVAAAGAVMMYLYFSTVDAGWFFREAAERGGQEMSKAQLDALAKSGDNPFFVWSSTIGAMVGTLFFTALWALYFLLAGKLTGLAVSFKQGLALAGWASMPQLIGSLLGGYVASTMSPQTFPDALALTALDPMLLQLPPESPWKVFA